MIVWNGDVVLADEVVVLGIGVLPPVLPGVGCPLYLRPFLGRREVSDHGVEPHVDLLARTEPFDGYVDSPIDVSRYGPIMEAFLDPSEGEVEYVFAPALAALQPAVELVREVGQAQVEVLCLPALGGGPRELRLRVYQIDRVECAPAVVALITPCFAITAVWTRSLYVPIRQEPLDLGVEELLGGAPVDEALFMQAQEDVLSHRVMVGRSGRGVQLPFDRQRIPAVDELGVIAIDDLLRGHALLVGTDSDRRAVNVASRDHQHPIARNALVPGKNIRGEIRPAR